MSPTWAIIDSACEPSDSKVNEDRFGAQANLAWVIDGATSLSDQPVTDAASDASWLVDIIVKHLEQHAAAGTESLGDILRDTIAKVVDESESWSSTPQFPPSAAIAILRANEHNVEYVMLADVSIVSASGQVISDRRVDVPNQPALDELTNLLRAGATFADARLAVNDLLINTRTQSMNKPGGYWVIATEREAAQNAISGVLTHEECANALLTTDGFSRIVDLMGIEANWDRYLSGEIKLSDGLQRLRSVENDDADARQYPRWSKSDDATAMRVQLRVD